MYVSKSFYRNGLLTDKAAKPLLEEGMDVNKYV